MTPPAPRPLSRVIVERRPFEAGEPAREGVVPGEHRQLEDHLRKQLALAESGEAVSPERQWLARAQLGGLLLAEWRLDEAEYLYRQAASGEHRENVLQALSELYVKARRPEQAVEVLTTLVRELRKHKVE